MKRDFDLIRRILIAVEAAGYGTVKTSDFVEAGIPEALVADHFVQLVEHGLIRATINDSLEWGPLTGIALRLTAEGHDFLAAIKNDTVWETTRTVVLKKGGAATLSIVYELAKSFLATKLGIA